MYVCMHVCMYVCVCVVYTCVYIYIYVCVCVCGCVQYILIHLCGLEILGSMLHSPSLLFRECLVASCRHVDPTSPQVLRCRKQPEAARVSHLGLSKFPNWTGPGCFPAI